MLKRKVLWQSAFSLLLRFFTQLFWRFFCLQTAFSALRLNLGNIFYYAYGLFLFIFSVFITFFSSPSLYMRSIAHFTLSYALVLSWRSVVPLTDLCRQPSAYIYVCLCIASIIFPPVTKPSYSRSRLLSAQESTCVTMSYHTLTSLTLLAILCRHNDLAEPHCLCCW